MNLFLEIFKIIDAIIRLIGEIVAAPFTTFFMFNSIRAIVPLERVQSFLGVIILLMPVISLVICKAVKEDAYSLKTKIWLLTLFMPLTYIPLRYLISQIYFLILDMPINPAVQEIFTTEFFIYIIIQLFIACFAYLFIFKGIKNINEQKSTPTPKLLTLNDKNGEHNQLRNLTMNLVKEMNIDMPETLVLKLENPILFTIDEKKKKPLIIASTGLVKLLDNEELEACLGHELAHIMNKDSAIRKISSFLRAIMFYNPLGYFIESTIYCEREFLADRICARITKKPEALASALIKIVENTRETRNLLIKQKVLCLFKGYKFLLKKHPPLEERLKRLMRLAENKELL